MNSKQPSALRRALPVAAAVVAVVSLGSMAAILGLYAAGQPGVPALFAIGLFGLPLAFVLLVAHVLLGWRERRRA
ncbi:hypothetical protein ACQ3I4_10935 [Zafaria sp. Z1313]|uniref:hypothetical protein n=1 Tax=Zafaria sp. Z1313 TaxID=3423202 RepID=UPI003D303553